MRYGRIPGVGDRVSRLALGTMLLSPERMDEANSLLDAFVEAGGNIVDTAYIYGRGNSERAIGRWLAERRPEELIILGKGGSVRPVEEGTYRVTPEAIDAQIAESLERLQVDCIDLWMPHIDEPRLPVEVLVDCLNRHVEAGHIQAVGTSNWSHPRIQAANAYAKANGLRGIVASSANLALAVSRENWWGASNLSIAGNQDALEWYRDTRFPLIAWSSQARGFFTGRYSPEEPNDPDMVRVYYTEDNWERLRRAREIATRYGCTSSQVALAWLLHQPQNVFAIIGPATPDELRDCLDALTVELTPDEVSWLNLESSPN